MIVIGVIPDIYHALIVFSGPILRDFTPAEYGGYYFQFFVNNLSIMCR